MITIPADAFKAAGKLLKRLPFTRATLPVFTHVAVHADTGADTVTLAVATLDGRLETCVPLADTLDHPVSFLLPPEALRTALKADKGSVLSLSLVGRGAVKRRTVQLRVTCGGISVETRHPAEDIDSFPECPMVEGPAALIPARTIEMLGVVASCASTNETRQILNGVHFTPEDGGMLVATDGKRLAGAPATVPPAASFILPSAAVHILAHPDFMSRSCTVTMSEPKDGDDSDHDRLVCFQSDQHRIITRTLSGTYPNWKQVLPREMVASLTIAEDRRPAIVAWLRSLRGREGSVTLRRKKRGVLRLTHATNGTVTATVEVPATETGEVPPITLDPGYLATALEIAPVLWLTDSMNPVVARRPDGVFCVVMPMRLAGGQSTETKAAAPSPGHAAA